ncbi:MAG TPA: hypothetical protein VK636_15875 [Gemmatimonadaceae bacterium]|nr:hypothetical protein [Gemmatimonadaceae bacterium]
MPATKLSARDTQANLIATKFGVTLPTLRATKITAMTAAQQAKALGVSIGSLVAVPAPIVLSPAKPITGSSNLTVFSSMMVDPTWPVGTGQALFSSAFPAGVDPGAQVAFNRVKTGHTHLVEFHVTLNMNAAYKFRVFTYPLGDFVDVTIQGPKTTSISALAPPVDEIAGTLELGASIQQRNAKVDSAGWSLQSVEVNVIG